MSLTTIFFFFFFFFLVFFFSAKFITQKRVNLPPSPLAFPVIGHLHLLKEPLHRTLGKLSQKFGPILYLKFGAKKVLVVSSAAAAEESFTQNDVTFANRPRFLVGEHLNYNYSTIGFAQYGDPWRTLRRLTAVQLLSPTRLTVFSTIWRGEVKLLLKQLQLTSDQMKVELSSKLAELAFNIMLRMVAGKRYYGVDAVAKEAVQFRDIMKEWLEVAGATNLNDFFPLLKLMDFQGIERKMKRVMEKMDRFLQLLVEEHKRSRNQKEEADRDRTLIDVMLSQQETEPDFYTDQTIKATILAMLIAGTETTSTTLEWAMSLLLNHPNKMHKLWSEIEAKVGQEKLLDETEVPKLNYLNCCISETMRLFPAVPLLLPHESSAECIVGGYTVPRGTMLLVNLWTIQRDPNMWEEAEKFMPERFESGEIGEGFKFIPFSAGRRACPGATLARKVMGLALGSMVQVFEWKRVSEEVIDMREGSGFSLPKAQPVEAMCVVRPKMSTLICNP